MNILDIKPYSKNAKKHPTKQVEQIANSIKEFGFNQPVVVDKNNIVIVGHGRLEAAKLLGLTDVPTIQVDLTEEQAKAYRLADNKLNESDWDMDLVIEELKGLSSEMLDLTGFDKDLIIEPDEKDDEVPPTPETPQTVLGDLYELGPHKLLCGDSTQEEAVLRLMDGKKADMVFTDPPYGINLLDPFRKGNLMVWAKRHWVYPYCKSETENKVFGSAFELCWVYPYCKKEIWFIRAINQSNEALGEHPTQKPTELAVRAISRNTEEGAVVVDAFLGSGSTLIACEKIKRKCYGLELSEKYCDVIVQRYCDYVGSTDIKKNGKITTWQK